MVAPVITQQPANESQSPVLREVTLTAKATGALSAKWFVSSPTAPDHELGSNFDQGTSTLTLTKYHDQFDKDIYCAFTNADGTTKSSVARVTTGYKLASEEK